MTSVIISHDEIGLKLTSKIVSHPSGDGATIYEVWQLIDGKWLGIGNGGASDYESAERRFQERLAELQGNKK